MTQQSPNTADRSNIVIADTPEAVGALRATLDEQGRLIPAASLQLAQQLVDVNTSLVICGCHFDEGRMYDLLRWVRAQPQLKTTPFLTIRVLEGGLDDPMYESVEIATKALGGDGFIDLFRWQRKYGTEQAAVRLASTVRALATRTAGWAGPGS